MLSTGAVHGVTVCGSTVELNVGQMDGDRQKLLLI